MSTVSKSYCIAVLLVSIVVSGAFSQETKTKNSKSWVFSGLVQIQHLYSPDIKTSASETNNGFRVRRGRLKVDANLSDYVSAIFQIEASDNNPRMKDAEIRLKLFSHVYARFGQFKVPVWREELRSTSKLFLIERSTAARFLESWHLSARQIGVEVGSSLENGVEIAANYSNGAGEGGREDAGREKQFSINNGKLFTGRINVPFGELMQIGVSGAVNQLGVKTVGNNSRGIIFSIIPDFGLYFGENLAFEGGMVYGQAEKEIVGTNNDQKFLLFNIEWLWKNQLTRTITDLAGLKGFEIAGGVTHIDPNQDVDNDEVMYVRFGPAVHFTEKTRLQLNLEMEDPAGPADSNLLIRTQLNVSI